MTWFKSQEKKIKCPACGHENVQEIEVSTTEKDLGTVEMDFPCGGCGAWLSWRKKGD